MELVALRYCVATMQLGRVTAAAEHFHVAPSAVSRAIRNVERELGVDLFDRVGRLLRPTSEGAAFLRDIGTAVQSLDDAVRTTRQRAGVDQGVVRVGFLTSLGTGLVPDVLEAVRRLYPGITLELSAGSGRAVLEYLRGGGADVVIGVPHLFDEDDVDWVDLYEEELVCVVAAGHPWSAVQSVTLDELARAGLVMLSPDFSVRRLMDARFEAAGLTARVVFEGPDAATVAGLVRAGIGPGVLPDDALRRGGAASGLIRIGIASGVTRRIAAGMRRRRQQPPAVTAFIDTVRQVTAGLAETRGPGLR